MFPLLSALVAWQPLTHRNCSQFTSLPGVKLVHLHRGAPSELFLSVHRQFYTELGIRSAAIDCSAQKTEKFRRCIGACTGGTLRLIGGPSPSNFRGEPTETNAHAWARSLLSCDNVTELTSAAHLEETVAASSTIVLFPGTSRIPKLFCHLAMMYADAALRFAVALTGPASPDLLGLAEPPAVHVWARGTAEAASYTGPVLFEPLEAHVSSVAAEAQRALHRAREWREAAMVTVGLTLLGLVVVATIYFGWVSVRASVIGVGAASYLLAEATPTAIATVAGLAVLSFAGVLLRQHMRAGPTDAVQARSALERALAAAEQGRFETGWWYRQRRAAAQAEVEECAVRYAAALVACPGELPPKGTYTDPASLFAALRPKTEGALVPVRLLRSSWIKARAARLRAATSEEERRRLALPRRQALERDEPGAFLSADEMEALPRHDEVLGGQLALGASSYCWLTGAAGDTRTHAADVPCDLPAPACAS